MKQYARVQCPDCLGASADPAAPFCGPCHCQGHIDIDRNADGTIPPQHHDGRPVVPWVDESEAFWASFTPTPNNNA